MTQNSIQSTAAPWARFRFSVVGPLLSSPPERGELKSALESLADKTWIHPVTGRDVQFSAKTIESWLYRARHEREDPIGALRQAVRKDCGKISINAELAMYLTKQYDDYPHWSYQLHYGNLKALVEEIGGDGGAVLAAYRDPLGEAWQVLAALPIEKVRPTPYQRDLSEAHVKRLTKAFEDVGRFLDPVIAVRTPDGWYETPNGRHRTETMRQLGARSIVALVVPEPEMAFVDPSTMAWWLRFRRPA